MWAANIIRNFMYRIREWFEKPLLNNLTRLEEKFDTISRNVDFANSRIIGLEEKTDTISRNVDFGNSRIVWLEAITRVNTDVSKMPMSQGWQRLMHRGGAKMLELVDIICCDYKIPYFLYGGSLIGAKLYGKSVQWDDDWDIGMLRDDYEKFRELCEILFNGSDFRPTFIGLSIQFQFRDTLIHGDVFPFDQYYKDIETTSDARELEEKIIKAKQAMDWNLWHWEEALVEEDRSPKIRNPADYRKTRQIYKDIIMEGRLPVKNGVLMENAVNPGKWVDGRLKYYTPVNNVFKYDSIFPLRRVKYEDAEVYAPCDIDTLLAQKYGDIYDLPSNLDSHALKLRLCDIKDVEELAAMDVRKVYAELKKIEPVAKPINKGNSAGI